MADAPEVDRPSTRPYIILRSRYDAGVYEYVATVEAGDADRAIKAARDALSGETVPAATYRDEWHAIPSRYWTTLHAETVVPPPETTWSQGELPGTQAPTSVDTVEEEVDERYVIDGDDEDES